MIYFNQAGTSWPKPRVVVEAMEDFAKRDPNQWLQVFEEGIETATAFFGIQNSSRFLFTQSCTQALGTVFSDFSWESGDRMLISHMEHHALSRWFYKVQAERGVEGVVIPRAADGPMDLEILEAELKKGAKMVAISMASNVTGEVLPYEEALLLSKKYGAFCVLDGAQAAGIFPINVAGLDPDCFVFAGHKGPLGQQGIGGLYLSERMRMKCPSAACEIVPGQVKDATFPTYCDVGSAPMMTIVGLTAALSWLNEKGLERVEEHISGLATMIRDGLEEIEEVRVMGSTSWGRYTGAVSIVCKAISLDHLKARLWEDSQIKGSSGFQCAPLAHQAIGSADDGTFRLSVGIMNTEVEVKAVLDALRRVVTGQP